MGILFHILYIVLFWIICYGGSGLHSQFNRAFTCSNVKDDYVSFIFFLRRFFSQRRYISHSLCCSVDILFTTTQIAQVVVA
jgi:hypothetical protein